MYKNVYFDISGKCNAICPWCTTGYKNRIKSKNDFKFLSLEYFKKAIKYMRNNKIIGDKTIVNLFNWGEPYLNPDFERIIEFLDEQDILFTLSTNASICRTLQKQNVFRNLKAITFSMPGFSQDSYNKIHGFNIEKVKENITTILANIREYGFKGYAQISLHIYQFNQHELELATEFANKLDIEVLPYYAYFNGLDMYMKYMKSEMEYTQLKKASSELMLYYIYDLLQNIPNEYRCPQVEEILAIDENCDVLTCCAIEKGMKEYSIGNLFNLSLEEIVELKRKQSICEECSRLGVHYLIHNPKQVYYNNTNNRENCNQEIQIKYDTDGNVLPAQGWLDYPQNESEINGIYMVNGWFLDGYGVSRVEILVDNSLLGKAIYGDLRPGFKEIFPQYNTNSVGFHYLLDTSLLKKGKHILVARMLNVKGNQYFTKEIVFYIK